MSENNAFEDIESLFHAALNLSEQRREAFLDEECGADSNLRVQVEALLREDENRDAYLDHPLVVDSTETTAHAFLKNDMSRIGPYKLLQEIGEGGFGVVYMAEQSVPVRRKVALKIIKPGMDSRAVVARFEAERQALALMDHPNIARVLDGGTTDKGTPFFAMDLVKGMPITDYCNVQQLVTRKRLELFLPVCEAIQHAHQKGIIHRDIKPSNVMITLLNDAPIPKVIDFGVAKALNQELTDKTLFTNYRAMVGTPQYMSPEQAAMSGIDVDTRSDVYALGILLYELLTGQPPFDRETFRDAGWEGMRNLICNTEPPKPSALVSTLVGDTVAEVSQQRQVEPTSLSRILRGELDWIVMKAIDKDRTRRYSTAAELAEDVRNYLNNAPVKASPPSVSYRMRKLASRNKTVIGTAAAILFALTLGTTIAGLGWAQASAANNQFSRSQTRLVDQLTDSTISATAAQLPPVVNSMRALSDQTLAKLDVIEQERPLAVSQKVNVLIARGELNPDTKVGDFLVKHLATMEGNYCPSLVSVLRKTNYDTDRLLASAKNAEQRRDLVTKSKLAILGLYLGQPQIAKDMFQVGLDPIQRTTLLSVFPHWHGNLSDLAKLQDSNTEFWSGVLQAVGSIAPKMVTDQEKTDWLRILMNYYESAPNLRTRNSAEWALRQWGANLPKQQAVAPSADRDWFVNSAGMTMRRIDPGKFMMGSWSSTLKYEGWDYFHDETPHLVEITNPYYFADREVTVALFAECAKEENFYIDPLLPLDRSHYGNLDLRTLMMFCNWLSRREKLEECYALDPELRNNDSIGGWRLLPGSNGYRLPTEAEWEFACRAGTITDYSWGQPSRFSKMFVSPPKQAGGASLPNPWGLFDTHGNLVEPCEDRYAMYPMELGFLNTIADPLMNGDSDRLVVRGRYVRSNDHRSSSRDTEGVGDALWPDDVGIRVVRSAPLREKKLQTENRIHRLSRLISINEPEDTLPHLAERGICSMQSGDALAASRDFALLLKLIDPQKAGED